MPISLNALLGIETREEKATKKRDATQNEYANQRMRLADEINRGYAEFEKQLGLTTEQKKRMQDRQNTVSDLAAAGAEDPERIAAQAATATPIAESEKSEEGLLRRGMGLVKDKVSAAAGELGLKIAETTNKRAREEGRAPFERTTGMLEGQLANRRGDLAMQQTAGELDLLPRELGLKEADLGNKITQAGQLAQFLGDISNDPTWRALNYSGINPQALGYNPDPLFGRALQPPGTAQLPVKPSATAPKKDIRDAFLENLQSLKIGQ